MASLRINPKEKMKRILPPQEDAEDNVAKVARVAAVRQLRNSAGMKNGLRISQREIDKATRALPNPGAKKNGSY